MVEITDSRGHAVRASDASVAERCVTGIERYVHWRVDAMEHLDAAIAADAGAPMPRLTKAWILQLGRSARFWPAMRKLADEAAACVDADDERANTYLQALEQAMAGNTVLAATTLQDWLARNPTDLLAHRLAQFELFWNGRARNMLAVVEAASDAWSPALPGYGDFLACTAFANEENGRYERAEACGRAAVEVAATDAWGAHAVAHVLIMQGRLGDGLQWLETLSANWRDANQIRHHLWWHLGLFALERDEHERILDLLVSEIRNPDSPLVQAVPDATIDIQNVASMLLRLELRGVDVGGRWAVLADISAGRVHNHAHPFSNAHDMMVLAATGQYDAAQTLLDSMREFVASADTTLTHAYRLAAIPLCEALLAHRQGRYDAVIDWLLPARHDLPLLGGSHAQRDLFYQVLFDAALRRGRHTLARLLLDEVRRIGFERVPQRTLYRAAA